MSKIKIWGATFNMFENSQKEQLGFPPAVFIFLYFGIRKGKEFKIYFAWNLER